MCFTKADTRINYNVNVAQTLNYNLIKDIFSKLISMKLIIIKIGIPT